MCWPCLQNPWVYSCHVDTSQPSLDAPAEATRAAGFTLDLSMCDSGFLMAQSIELRRTPIHRATYVYVGPLDVWVCDSAVQTMQHGAALPFQVVSDWASWGVLQDQDDLQGPGNQDASLVPSLCQRAWGWPAWRRRS
jgi:hypothetical protein